ncbi:MAG: cytochrome c1 [Gammaproteobacteria bacterium]
MNAAVRMYRIARFLPVSFLLAAAASSAAAAGVATDLPRAPVQYGDVEAMQRGAATFVNYCLGCHSAEYMRYGRLTEDAGLSGEQVREFLIHGDAGLGDGMRAAMDSEDGKKWFYQASPPDLTLSSRLRGPDWLYAYLRGFYRDPDRPGGWNNTIFSNAAMPNVLADLQGVQIRGADGDLEQLSAGRMSPAEFDALVGDLVTFMAYMGEPSREARYKTGYLVLAFLLTLLLPTYFLYREYWRDIH